MLNPRTGELFSPACKNNRCLRCVAWKVQRITDALHLVGPDWLVTIDMVGERWKAISRNLTRLRRAMRESHHLLMESAYFVEPYVRGGHHAHMLLTGPSADIGLLFDSADQVGLRLGQVERVTHHGRLEYGLKMTKHADTLPAFLNANNGTLVHATRGFWKVPGGEPVRGGYAALLRDQAVGA